MLFSRFPFFLVFGALLLTSCSGLKSLVERKDGLEIYAYQGDTIGGWSLTRQDSLWGYVSSDGLHKVPPIFIWAGDFSDSMALVQYNGIFSFVNERGKLLRKVKMQNAYPFSEGGAAVQKGEKWGYIDKKGKWTVKPRFDWASPFSSGRARVSIGIKQGVIDEVGTVIVPPTWDRIEEFVKGTAIVRNNAQYGLIDTVGEILLPVRLRAITAWGKDYYRLETSDKKIGIADLKGNLVMDTVFNTIEFIRDNYVRVSRDNKIGLYDPNMQQCIPLEYDFLGFISEEGLIAAKKDNKWGFLNTAGEVLLPFEYEECSMGFQEGRSWLKQDGQLSIIDAGFNVVQVLSYDYAGYFHNDYAIVGRAGKASYESMLYGYVDVRGDEIISPQYHTATPFNKYGLTIVGWREQGITERFVVNSKGEVLTTGQSYYGLQFFGDELIYNQGGAKFTFLSPESGAKINGFAYSALFPLKYSDRNDLATVSDDQKKGLIDYSLAELIPPVLDDIGVYVRDRLHIKRDGLWGFADEHFRVRIPFVYDEVGSFRYGLAVVEKGGAKGAIRKDGRLVIPLAYANITIDYVSDRIYAQREGGYDIYDQEGRLLLETDFSYLGGYWGSNHIVFRKDDKSGALDYEFRILSEPVYDGIGPFYEGLAWVRSGGKGGYVDSQFALVVPLECDYLEDFALGFARVRKEGRDYYIDTEGKEYLPDETEITKREEELERRKDSFFNFSS